MHARDERGPRRFQRGQRQQQATEVHLRRLDPFGPWGPETREEGGWMMLIPMIKAGADARQ